MTQLTATPLEDGVAVEIDDALYPRDAVFGAAFTFIDRCWVHLDRVDGGRLRATLRPKPGAASAVAALAGELENELLGQAWRQEVADENHALVERVMTAALGPGLAPGAGDPSAASGDAAPPLDDLLAGDAFEDPLGIALSWEEKYAKKSTQALDPAAAPIDDGSRAKEPGA
jgi:His-Xaa-Ser system protein HxsD